MGTDYRSYLASRIAGTRTHRADLVVFFLLRGQTLINASGSLGMLATRGVVEGASRRVGLDPISERSRIYRAEADRPWPGDTSVRISTIWFTRRAWEGAVRLDGSPVDQIDGGLCARSSRSSSAHRLPQQAGSALIGAEPMGDGFILSPAEAADLISQAPDLREVVRPYLGGDDLVASPEHLPSRWCIYFWDWPLERCDRFGDALTIVEDRVRPQRLASRNSEQRLRENWWQFGRPAVEVLSRMITLNRVICFPETSKVLLPAWSPVDVVPSNTVVVVLDDTWSTFSVLTSGLHRHWAIRQGTLLGQRHRYMPSACFETFPQPPYDAAVEAAGKALDENRSAFMIRNDEGLTKTYNRVHHPDDTSPPIAELRALHVALDLVVRDAYGWSDLDLDHGFHDTPQGLRFTLGPAARIEVLGRLLELNHERYAEEVAAGLHGKKPAAKGRKKKPSGDAPTLL